jgi:hypothetical protein
VRKRGKCAEEAAIGMAEAPGSFRTAFAPLSNWKQ